MSDEVQRPSNTAARPRCRPQKGVHSTLSIDLALPDMDGLDLMGRCRAQGSSAPVLVWSSRRSVDARVKGIEHGGDAFIRRSNRQETNGRPKP
ncbi:MAG: response regulator [Candidatus Dormibacteraceae bacterium]